MSNNRRKSDGNNLEIENKFANDKQSEYEINNEQEEKERSLKHLIPTPTPTNFSSSEVSKIDDEDKILSAPTAQSFPNIAVLSQEDLAQALRAKQLKFKGFGAQKNTSHRMSIS